MQMEQNNRLTILSGRNILAALMAVVVLTTTCCAGGGEQPTSPSDGGKTAVSSGDWVTISSIMDKVVYDREPVKIVLIGDSITQGVGSSDYNPAGEVIVKENPKLWRRNTGKKAWSAMLKKRLETDYNAQVTNNGIRGVSTHQILYFWDQLVEGDEDIAIVMLGTNNRTLDDEKNFKYTKQSLYDELQEIKDRLEANGTQVIFMSAGPVGLNNEKTNGKHFHMNDVEEVIEKFAADNHREYISIYKKTMEYMDNTDTDISDLLADGIHPNDKLHLLYYKWVSDGLGLSRKIDSASW